jgi:hypothetical protein
VDDHADDAATVAAAAAGTGGRPPGPTGQTRAVRRLLPVVATLIVLLGGVACGSSGSGRPAGIQDSLTASPSQTLPVWFPSRFVPPPGSRIVEVIQQPEAGLGRTVTWKVPGTFDDAVTNVERTLNNLGWKPSDKTISNEGGSKRTTFFVDNGEIYAARVYEDEALPGVRLTVELPHTS